MAAKLAKISRLSYRSAAHATMPLHFSLVAALLQLIAP